MTPSAQPRKKPSTGRASSRKNRVSPSSSSMSASAPSKPSNYSSPANEPAKNSPAPAKNNSSTPSPPPTSSKPSSTANCNPSTSPPDNLPRDLDRNGVAWATYSVARVVQALIQPTNLNHNAMAYHLLPHRH